MNTQAKLIYGESRSPTRAHFQKTPVTLSHFLLDPPTQLTCIDGGGR
jgi:hypothetical protein